MYVSLTSTLDTIMLYDMNMVICMRMYRASHIQCHCFARVAFHSY